MGNADKGGWQKWEKENVLPLFVGASIEITQSVFVTNLPGWMRGIYNVISRGLPQHITKRLRVPGDTAACLKNAEFLEHVGASLFAACLKLRKIENMDGADDDAMAGENRVLGPGRCMERVIEVDAGAQVCWSFKIGQSVEVGGLGKALNTISGQNTDLHFMVRFMPEHGDDTTVS